MFALRPLVNFCYEWPEVYQMAFGLLQKPYQFLYMACNKKIGIKPLNFLCHLFTLSSDEFC